MKIFRYVFTTSQKRERVRWEIVRDEFTSKLYTQEVA